MAAATSRRWALDSQLLVAIQNSDVPRASKLFHDGVDTDTRFSINSEKRLAICLCVENNDIEMTKLMIQLGASVSQKDSNGTTPIHITCENGYLVLAQTLLQSRANPHAKNKYGQTPLHLAAKSGHKDLVDLMVNCDVNLNEVDLHGRTALHLAALVSNSQLVESLLEAGADAKIEDKRGNTALHYAVDSVGTGVEGIAALSKAFPWAAIRANEQKKTPLHIIVGSDRKDAAEGLKAILLEIPFHRLMSPPVALSPRSERGHTPLHLAVLERNVSLVRVLVASGAEIDTRDQLGRTPLECAVRDMDLGIVAILLAAGASTRRLVSREGIMPHVINNEMREVLKEAALRPLRLSSICRRVITRTAGAKFQRSLDQVPRRWRDFLSYEEI